MAEDDGWAGSGPGRRWQEAAGGACAAAGAGALGLRRGVAAGLGGRLGGVEGEKLEVEDEGEPLDFNPVVQKIE